VAAVVYNRRGAYIERHEFDDGSEAWWWVVYYLWERVSGVCLSEDDAFAALEHWWEQRRGRS
jgi:hypothetical protein